ncbi:VOC family protein [Actinocorallia populi]|uniref:VOC family protein n=1 Tax=Actinocorallia populi TaxID=2079200 RepID=UPI000D08F005|nr:VOC family protein [Actinocorallia populi]
MLLGLRTIVYPAADLAAATEWYTRLLGFAPYFEEPYYVGFDVGGYELALQPPHLLGGDTPITYWGVPDIGTALARLLEHGATEHGPVRDVGGGIRVATVLTPQGTVFGVIENPHFAPREKTG